MNSIVSHVLRGPLLPAILLVFLIAPGAWAADGSASEPVAAAVTVSKVVEQEIKESERILGTLMDNLPGIAYRCKNDKNWSMEFISNGCLELTGYSPSELIGKKSKSWL